MRKIYVRKVMLAAAVLAMVFASGCKSKGNDGSFSGTAQGFGGEVTTTITVTNGRVSDVVIQGDKETPAVGGQAIPVLREALLAKGSADIDTVSGATITSNAVIAGAAEAFEKAGISSQSASADVPEEEVTADVVVIGMGASGTVAAISAAENGAMVVGIESSERLGGMGNAAQGMFAIGSVLQEQRYGSNLGSDEKYWFNAMFDRTQDLGNGRLIRMFVAEAKNTISYMLEHGVQFFLSAQPQQIAHFGETIVYHRWNDTHPFEFLAESLEREHVDVRYKTTAVSLIKDGDKVVGVVAQKADGGRLTVHADAVIVATGGFSGNDDMMKEALGEEAFGNAVVIKGSDGSGIQMMYDAGAAKGELLSMNHGVSPGAAQLQVADQLMLNTPILWINGRGERFMNEDLLKDTVEFSSAVLAQGGIAYTLADQTLVDRWCDTTQANTGSWVHYWDRFGIIGADGNRTIYHATVDKDEFLADFETLKNSGDGAVVNSLEEAAAFIGCDVDTLTATIEEYNAAVDSGVDNLFFKDAEDLIGAVKTFPLYIVRGCSVALGSLGGVNVTDKLEVLDAANKVIPGLYSTGNNDSGMCVAAYGNVEGVGLGFALTSGRMAGRHAAAFAAQ